MSRAKVSGFKSTVETIYSHLLENISNSSMYSKEYANSLNNRLSSKSYVIEGTKCLRNRYGMNEASIMSFNEIFLKDSVKQIEAENEKT